MNKEQKDREKEEKNKKRKRKKKKKGKGKTFAFLVPVPVLCVLCVCDRVCIAVSRYTPEAQTPLSFIYIFMLSAILPGSSLTQLKPAQTYQAV